MLTTKKMEMIFKKTIFFLMFFSSCMAQENNLISQSFKTSKPYKVFDFDNNFFVSKNNEIVVLKFIRNHCIIQRFDSATPQLINENRYSDFFPKGFKLETFNEIDGNFYFFYSYVNKEKKCDEIFAQEVDFEKAEFIGLPKIILSSVGEPHFIKQNSYLHNNRINAKSYYEFIQPRDKSSLLVKYITSTDKREFSSIELTLLDKNLTNLFTKSIPFEIDHKKSIILSSHIDKKGNFYFVSRNIIDEDDKKKTHKIFLSTVKSNSNDISINKMNLNFESKFINELWIKDFNDEIICGGFTSDYENTKENNLFSHTNKNDSNGIAIYKINSQSEITGEYKFSFPENVINFYKNQKNINHINNLYLHDFDVLENGEIIVIGEQFLPEPRGPKNTYVYRDIIICKLNKNGELGFIKRLPKLQESDNESQPYSFKSYYTDNFLYLPFIDNIKNLEDKTITKVKNCSGDLILSKVSLKDGNIMRKFILNIGHNDANLNKFSINRFYKSNLNSFCFDAYIKNKEDVIISVELN